jgi:hypothetical protein
MDKIKRLTVVVLAAVIFTAGATTPALADRGGEPNGNSCGGIGREKPAFDPDYNFPCDEVGQSNASPRSYGPGQGFPPPSEP